MNQREPEHDTHSRGRTRAVSVACLGGLMSHSSPLIAAQALPPSGRAVPATQQAPVNVAQHTTQSVALNHAASLTARSSHNEIQRIAERC